MVPLTELTNERKKLKGERDEERRLRMEAEARAKVYQEQIEAARRQPPPQAPQPRQQVRIPDPIAEPEQYARFVHQTAQQQVFDAQLNASEDRARDKYGDAVVDEAFQAAQAAGLVGSQSPLLQQRHPWGAMVEWHKQQKALQTIGSDPEAYANRIREEERQKVLAELKAGNGPTAGAPQQFPGTLASATQQGATGQITKNLEAATQDVFAPDRKARGMRR